jgi:hypothetical protein
LVKDLTMRVKKPPDRRDGAAHLPLLVEGQMSNSAASTRSSTLDLTDSTTVVRLSLLTAPMVLYPGTSPSCDQ